MTWVCDDFLILEKCKTCIHNCANTKDYNEDRYPDYVYDDFDIVDCKDYEELNK